MNIGGRVNVGKSHVYVPYYGSISTDPTRPGVQGTTGSRTVSARGHLGAQRRLRNATGAGSRHRPAEGQSGAVALNPLLDRLALVQDEAVAFGVFAEGHMTHGRVFDRAVTREMHAARA